VHTTVRIPKRGLEGKAKAKVEAKVEKRSRTASQLKPQAASSPPPI
jgi:hypothetical protein